MASNKQQIKWQEVKETTKKLENGLFLSGLSRDKRIKTEQNKQTNY